LRGLARPANYRALGDTRSGGGRWFRSRARPRVYFNAGLAYSLNRRLGVEWCVAGPSALIGASNFFELAVATAIALFGFQSGAALSTVVGVLVEVPVMLSVVHIRAKVAAFV
jgi:ACR3 family arsenite efflux pump ArsB